jgi:hypothetical protein
VVRCADRLGLPVPANRAVLAVLGPWAHRNGSSPAVGPRPEAEDVTTTTTARTNRVSIPTRGLFSLGELALFGFGHRNERSFDGDMRMAFRVEGYLDGGRRRGPPTRRSARPHGPRQGRPRRGRHPGRADRLVRPRRRGVRRPGPPRPGDRALSRPPRVCARRCSTRPTRPPSGR